MIFARTAISVSLAFTEAAEETPTTRAERENAAAAALARAIHRAWPAKTLIRFGEGWSKLLLAALRSDPEGRAAVAAALLDDPKPAPAEQAGEGSPDPRLAE